MDKAAIQRVQAITRPESALLTLYFLRSLFALVAFPIVFIPLWIRYRTLRYRFDDDGVRVSWGLLFRREHLVRYTRIQDIHLSRGLLERWLGIGTVEIQTAAASASAEATITGVRDFDLVRDFLYMKMRDARFGEQPLGDAASGRPRPDASDEVVALLTEIRDELHALRARSS